MQLKDVFNVSSTGAFGTLLQVRRYWISLKCQPVHSMKNNAKFSGSVIYLESICAQVPIWVAEGSKQIHIISPCRTFPFYIFTATHGTMYFFHVLKYQKDNIRKEVEDLTAARIIRNIFRKNTKGDLYV